MPDIAGVIQHRTVCAEDAAVGGVLQAHLCPLLAVSIQALQVGLSTAVILEVGHDHIRIAGAQVLGDLVEVLAVPAALQEVQSGICHVIAHDEGAGVVAHLLDDLYLDSFPAGTNPTFRKRREYDCSCCRRFVKNIGKLVSFMDGQMVTVWDFETKSDVYQPVVDALAAYVKTCAVVNPYYISRNIISDGKFGTEMNYEYDADHKAVRTWDHFAVEIPQRFIVNSYDVSTKMAEWRDSANVFKRSLEELTMNAVDTVLELIAQNSLYRGKEFEGLVRGFKSDKQVYDRLPDEKKSAYVWMAPGGASMNRLRIRNTAID